jgi:2-hydroxy-3-oxopropionate reductase
MKTIGFIGLGIMGRPMARNLVKAGYSLVVCDVNPAPVEELVELGAKTASTPAEVVSQVEMVITMLPNSPDVQQVVTGPKGVIEGARPGLILVDMSSIAPLVAQEVGKAAAARGVKMLDAPVSGGEPKAIDGTLSIMVGGDKDTVDAVEGVLKNMAASVVLVGPLGSGNVTKLSNQIIVALNIIAVSEALVLSKKAGVDPRTVYQAIRGGLAGSTVLDAKAPLMLDRNFKPGFRIELHLKDLMNVMETAEKLGAPLPFSGLATEVLNSLVAAGKGKNDHGGIVQHFEALAGVEVR